MNRMVQEVNIAAREQSVGGNNMREAVDRIRTIVQEVGMAVKEQVQGAKQIVQAVDNMHNMMQAVANATNEQKLGGDTVVKAMEGMSNIVSGNLNLSAELKKASEEATYQVETLQYSVSTFRIHANGRMRCWDIMNCPTESRHKCPAFEAGEDRCWLISGTWCRGAQQGDSRSKLRNCMTCKAFKQIQELN
jgi:methyl-accepting chemotaxis protein